MRTLNVRLSGILLVGTLLVSGAAYGIHELQMKRHAKALLREADAAQARDDRGTEIDYLLRYVALVKQGNPDELARLGTLLSDARRYVLAFQYLERALRQEPQRE